MSDPTIHWGLLGWSNKRSGLEFYRWDEKTIPHHGSEWGDLLALDPQIADMEGSPVAVVVMPRNTDSEGMVRLTAALDHAVRLAFPADAEQGNV